MQINHYDDIGELLTRLQFEDAPCGGALSVFYEGQCVINHAFGAANLRHDWTCDTLSINFSIGKGVMASLIAVLVSQGVLQYEQTIAHYWPQFAQNSKGNIRLIDVLTHRADLFDIGSVIDDVNQMADWQGMLDKVASMAVSAPTAKPDIQYASAYSALVSGWILGGVVTRATGLSLQEALDGYLCAPLGLTGQLYFGVPTDKFDELAVPYRLFYEQSSARQKPTIKPDSEQTKQLLNDLPISADWRVRIDGELSTQSINRLYFDGSKMNLTNYKRALTTDGKTPIDYYAKQYLGVPIPAANGVSSSHALAVLYAMHANDGVWQDKTLIDAQTLAQMRAIYSDGFDAVMPANMQWRAGFHRLFSMYHVPGAYGHMGYNGSVAFCDPNKKLSFAFIHNFDTTMLNDVRQFVLSESLIKFVNGF